MECTVIVSEISYSIMIVKRCQSDIIMYFYMSGCSVTSGSYFKNKIAEFKVKHEK